MKQTLRRDWETCELEMSAVHHSILQPTFSLLEQHHCPRITYTDASLHLHSAVLLLLEQKLLLGVGKNWKTRPLHQPPHTHRWTENLLSPLLQISSIFLCEWGSWSLSYTDWTFPLFFVQLDSGAVLLISFLSFSFLVYHPVSWHHSLYHPPVSPLTSIFHHWGLSPFSLPDFLA